ncbi:MAG TPA: dephospho-CoA kinase [Desulfonatronum sp.]|nr:dephospho-CoA kinase [Desulfonatronum sp.]
MLRISVASSKVGLRLDQVVTDHVTGRGITRSRVQDWIKAGLVSIDGVPCRRPSRRLYAGELLQIDPPSLTTALIPETGELDVIFQDNDLVVLNKPAGLVVHPAPGLNAGTLVHRLLGQFPELQNMDGARPGIVHRLDKDTTGLIVVALNEAARLSMAEDFAARRVQKTYLALVYGLPDQERALIDAPIDRHTILKTRMTVVPKGGRQALSEYRVLWSDPRKRFSLLAVRIQTGRTHQIRVHLQHIGHPLLGDPVYSRVQAHAQRQNLPWAKQLLKRPMLHAWRLALPHPFTGQNLQFQLSPPRDFWRVMLVCSRQVQRIGLTGLPGCGKSVLLAALAGTGLPIWNADAAVRELYQPGGDGWDLLRRIFGARFVPDEAGAVDTTALLAAMRASSALRREVETMIHPLVAHKLESFWQDHARCRAAAAEVPLLVEGGWRSDFDVIAGIYCSHGLRRQWLAVSRGWDQELQADVESWQWSELDKLRACDMIVENPGNLEGAARRAEALGRILQWLRRRKVRRLLREVMNLVTDKKAKPSL